MKLQMNMKINNYIKAKQHYIPPIIEILEVEEEPLLGNATAEATGGDFNKDPDDEDEGGNSRTKQSLFFDADDEIEW